MNAEREEIMVPGEEEVNGLPYIEMNPAARFTNIFISPTETFMSLTRSTWAWVIPIVIVFLVGMASYSFLKPIVIDEQIRRMENAPMFSSMSDSQKEEIMTKTRENMENPPIWQWAIAPVGSIATTLIISAILLLIGNIILGGDAKYVGMLHVYSFATLISVPETIVKAILIHLKQSMDVHTSLALIMPSGDTTSFLYNFFDKMDIFTIWLLAVVTIGMSVFLPKVQLKKIGVWVVVFWLIWVILSALASKFTGGMFGI